MSEHKLTAAQFAAYWNRTRNLMLVILFAWFVFSFGVHFFAPSLNKIRVLGFPLGFYMASQGALIAFVAMCWWNAWSQDKIDREFGVSDE